MLHSGIAFSMNDTCDADKKKEERLAVSSAL